jgi:hypothetical protein
LAAFYFDLVTGRLVGHAYLGITSDLPVNHLLTIVNRASLAGFWPAWFCTVNFQARDTANRSGTSGKFSANG